MSSIKVIENPEVPGYECLLPPPPPPPPPVIPSKETKSDLKENSSLNDSNVSTSVSSSESTTSAIPETANEVLNSTTITPYQNMTSPVAPYIIHPVTTQPAVPWWIPTDADTSDSVYNSWYEQFKQPTANVVTQPGPVKAKNKFFKRKNETIDPAQDAEKVASAQRELSALMKPLKCDLCNAVMNSTLQAKLHYDGKPHQKKVSMFLNQSVKKQKCDDGQDTGSNTSDWQNYCDICKTWFTSQTDASQHYAGKKHIRAANGGPRSRPSKKLSQNQMDPSGRFGIGTAFQTDTSAVSVTPIVVPDPAAAIVAVPGVAAIYTPPVFSANTPTYISPLRCDLCGVSANRQDQLETHKRGARHLRMLRLNGLPVPETINENESTLSTGSQIDYSIYRTPSGQYYCAPCNLSLNSETTFVQHIESKKHKNQSNPKSPSNAATPSKKARFKKK